MADESKQNTEQATLHGEGSTLDNAINDALDSSLKTPLSKEFDSSNLEQRQRERRAQYEVVWAVRGHRVKRAPFGLIHYVVLTRCASSEGKAEESSQQEEFPLLSSRVPK